MNFDLISTRTKDNKVKLSFFAEDMLRDILGSYYNRWHGHELTEKEWKHILKKISSKLTIAIKRNINTDYIHSEQLQNSLEHINRNIKDKINSDTDIILALVGLCFQLIGDLPNNSDKKHATNEKLFDLDTKRSIYYLQNNKQKMKLILDSANHTPFNDYYSYDDLMSKLYLDFNSNPRRFNEWYKSEYPKLYAMIF